MGKVASQISERINNMKFASEADVTDLKKAVNELADLFEKFVATPTEQPTKKVENYFKTDEQPNDNLNKWLQLRSTKKQSKN
jgi:hypothetical protein